MQEAMVGCCIRCYAGERRLLERERESKKINGIRLSRVVLVVWVALCFVVAFVVVGCLLLQELQLYVRKSYFGGCQSSPR